MLGERAANKGYGYRHAGAVRCLEGDVDWCPHC